MDSKNFLINIKSKYVLKKIAEYLQQKFLLKLIKNNKNLKNQLDITINDYKKYYENIEIEIIPNNDSYSHNFINVPYEYESYYHIYINDEKDEFERKNFNKDDNIKKIKIIIDKKLNHLKIYLIIVLILKK